jgi:RND family efflux transporter MFP subunit
LRAVELGQRVKAGQLLAQLDPTDYTLGAAASSRDLAAADFKRFKELRAQNFISAAELERRESLLIAAQAQWAQAQAQSTVQNNQAAYTRLYADAAGVVTAVEAEPGQVVSAGAPIVRIAQDGPRDAVFAVPEDVVGALKIGAAAQVQLWPAAAVMRGVVREVAASADPVTRTFSVKVALSAPGAPALGATVSVLLEPPASLQTPLIKLPTPAFLQDGQSTSVWVLDPVTMTVKLQPVQLVAADGNAWVVASGLAPGMQVVVAGVHVLSPGQKVTIYKEKVPVSPAQQLMPAINTVAPVAPVPAAK